MICNRSNPITDFYAIILIFYIRTILKNKILIAGIGDYVTAPLPIVFRVSGIRNWGQTSSYIYVYARPPIPYGTGAKNNR